MMLGKRRRKILAFFLAMATTLSMQMSLLASDYENHWASEAITEWKSNGVIDGYEDGTFKPNNKVTRAELATLIVRVFGVSGRKSSVQYLDVAQNAWYKNAVDQVTAMGWMNGKDGKFEPDRPATREEMMVALANAYSIKGSTDINFKDADDITPEALEDVKALVASGYVKGNPDGSLNPKGNLTRAEFVSILDRLTENFINKAGTYTGDKKGNVFINTPGVILENMVIDGNLYLAPGIGTGDATLNKVTVKGQTFIEGGGVNSIKFNDCTFVLQIVVQTNDPVRVVSSGEGCALAALSGSQVILTGTFGSVELQGSVQAEFRDVKAEEVVVNPAPQKVDVMPQAVIKSTGTSQLELVAKEGTILTLQGNFLRVEVPAGVETKLEGATAKEIAVVPSKENPEAKALIVADKASDIGRLQADAAADIQGEAKIKELTVNVEGVTSKIAAVTNTVKEGVKTTIADKEVTKDTAKTVNITPANDGGSGSGGSGGSKSPAPPAITFDLCGMDIFPVAIYTENYHQLMFNVMGDASKDHINWSKLKYSTVKYSEPLQPTVISSTNLMSKYTYVPFANDKEKRGTYTVQIWDKPNNASTIFLYLTEEDEKAIEAIQTADTEEEKVTVESGWMKGLVDRSDQINSNKDFYFGQKIGRENAYKIKASEGCPIDKVTMRSQYSTSWDYIGYTFDEPLKDGDITGIQKNFQEVVFYTGELNWNNCQGVPDAGKDENKRIAIKVDNKEPYEITLPSIKEWQNINKIEQVEVVTPHEIRVKLTSRMNNLTADDFELGALENEWDDRAWLKEPIDSKGKEIWSITQDGVDGSIYNITYNPEFNENEKYIRVNVKGTKLDPSFAVGELPKDREVFIYTDKDYFNYIDSKDIDVLHVKANIELFKNTIVPEGKTIVIEEGYTFTSPGWECGFLLEGVLHIKGSFINPGPYLWGTKDRSTILIEGGKVQGIGRIGGLDSTNALVQPDNGEYEYDGVWVLGNGQAQPENGDTYMYSWEDFKDSIGKEGINTFIIRGDYVSIKGDFTLTDNQTLIIPRGKELTIDYDAKLNTTTGSTLKIEGQLDIKGDLINEGEMEVDDTKIPTLKIYEEARVQGFGVIYGREDDTGFDTNVPGGLKIEDGDHYNMYDGDYKFTNGCWRWW